jgi:anti-sigma28 factor (negative regulator of flagellin synthesis)
MICSKCAPLLDSTSVSNIKPVRNDWLNFKPEMDLCGGRQDADKLANIAWEQVAKVRYARLLIADAEISMSSISQVSSFTSSIIGRIGPRGAEARGTAVGASASVTSDQVEISASAINAARQATQTQATTLDQARQARINAVRQQIQDGTYDLESRSTIVADRLARALRSI